VCDSVSVVFVASLLKHMLCGASPALVCCAQCCCGLRGCLLLIMR